MVEAGMEEACGFVCVVDAASCEQAGDERREYSFAGEGFCFWFGFVDDPAPGSEGFRRAHCVSL
jgi:hypothetical protein